MDDTRISNVESRVDKLEDNFKDMTQRQNKMENEQAETRVYVKQIFERIDDLKLLIQNAKKPSGNKEWIDLVKWIIGGTIFIIVAYIFGGGI